MATVEISPIEVLALKKLVLINDALARSLRDIGARREQFALLLVLNSVVMRADAENAREAVTCGKANPSSLAKLEAS